MYAEEFAAVRPSVYETIFDCNWYSRPGRLETDKLQQEYEVKRGDEWPTWEQFTQQDFTGVPRTVVEEINNKHEFSNRYLQRYDTHPVPAEYLEYLDTVAPELEITQQTREWTAEVTQAILEHRDIKKMWRQSNTPSRF